jgi:MOSC domain-containing protein YiiM
MEKGAAAGKGTAAGRVLSICVSGRKGEKKKPVPEAFLLENLGVGGDAHAEGGARQVSLLMGESIERMRREAEVELGEGDFAENIVTEGIDLGKVRVGDRLEIGGTPGGEGPALLRVTMIGKECKAPCRIYRQVGFCIMPREGIFCAVDASGPVRRGDRIRVIVPRAE